MRAHANGLKNGTGLVSGQTRGGRSATAPPLLKASRIGEAPQNEKRLARFD